MRYLKERKKWWTEEGDLRSNRRGEFIELMEENPEHADPRSVLCETEPDDTFKGVTDQQRADFDMIVADHNLFDLIATNLVTLKECLSQPGPYSTRAIALMRRLVFDTLVDMGEEVIE